MQPTLEKDDKQAGLSDLVAILEPDPARVMLEPPDLHADPVNRAMSLAAQLPAPDPALRAPPPPLKDTVAPSAQPRQPKTPSVAGRASRALLAIAVGAVITVGCLSYGEAARQMLAAWAPQLVAAPAAPAQEAKVAEQVATPAEQVAQPPAPPAATAAAAPPPAPETPAAPAQTAPVQTAAAPDLTPKLEEMAREIASLRETIEQLKNGQQQISRDLAKAIDQEPRRKTATSTSPSAPKPTTTAARNPSPPPPQAAYTPPPQQRQVYTPPRDGVYAPRDGAYSRREEVYAEPPRVYTPPPPQVYVPPPSGYEPGAPRPPRALP